MVVHTGLVPALGPDVVCLRVGVCISIHGVEPLVGGNDLNGRVHYGCRRADLDVVHVPGHETLPGDASIASVFQVVRYDFELPTISPFSGFHGRFLSFCNNSITATRLKEVMDMVLVEAVSRHPVPSYSKEKGTMC